MFSFIYLASQSSRRAELLKQLGVDFKLLIPQPQEDPEALEIAQTNERAIDYVQRVTLAKLEAALERLQRQELPFAPILCADTTVSIQSTDVSDRDLILGKPENAQHALEILRMLNGKVHVVYTAVSLQVDPHQDPLLKLSTSEVKFAQCDESMLRAYVETGEPMGKAGAYGIQGIGGSLIEKIEGSYTGIMGLPLYETAELLRFAAVNYKLSV